MFDFSLLPKLHEILSVGGSLTQALLDLGLFMSLDLVQVVTCGIVSNSNLVEGILRALVEFLPDPLLALLQAQANAAAVCLHLGESSLLILGIRSSKSLLRMLVNLGIVGPGRQRQGIERIIDTGRVQC